MESEKNSRRKSRSLRKNAKKKAGNSSGEKEGGGQAAKKKKPTVSGQKWGPNGGRINSWGKKRIPGRPPRCRGVKKYLY